MTPKCTCVEIMRIVPLCLCCSASSPYIQTVLKIQHVCYHYSTVPPPYTIFSFFSYLHVSLTSRVSRKKALGNLLHKVFDKQYPFHISRSFLVNSVKHPPYLVCQKHRLLQLQYQQKIVVQPVVKSCRSP